MKGIRADHNVTSIQGAFNQMTASIEKNTASEGHPGLITQIQNAGHTIAEKADALFGEHVRVRS